MDNVVLFFIDAKVYADISLHNQNTIIDIIKPSHKNHHIKNIRSHHHLQHPSADNNFFPILSINTLFIQSSILINEGSSVIIGTNVYNHDMFFVYIIFLFTLCYCIYIIFLSIPVSYNYYSMSSFNYVIINILLYILIIK